MLAPVALAPGPELVQIEPRRRLPHKVLMTQVEQHAVAAQAAGHFAGCPAAGEGIENEGGAGIELLPEADEG